MQEEDQLAVTNVSEKRDPNGRVQDDQVTAAVTPHREPVTKQSKSTGAVLFVKI